MMAGSLLRLGQTGASARQSRSLTALVTIVGVPEVLNNSPFTDTVLPTASNVWFGNSSKFMNGSIWTLIVVTGGVAPVNNGDRFVSVKLLVVVSILPTLPLTCDGHKRTRSVVIVVTPPADITVPGRICTS